MQKTVCQYLVPVLRNPWQKFYQLKRNRPKAEASEMPSNPSAYGQGWKYYVCYRCSFANISATGLKIAEYAIQVIWNSMKLSSESYQFDQLIKQLTLKENLKLHGWSIMGLYTAHFKEFDLTNSKI